MNYTKIKNLIKRKALMRILYKSITFSNGRINNKGKHNHIINKSISLYKTYITIKGTIILLFLNMVSR